jgi:hypothetical protein
MHERVSKLRSTYTAFILKYLIQQTSVSTMAEKYSVSREPKPIVQAQSFKQRERKFTKPLVKTNVHVSYKER